jgi:hypothetical protein
MSSVKYRPRWFVLRLLASMGSYGLLIFSAPSLTAADQATVAQEVLVHATHLCHCQPTTRSVTQVQKPYHPHRGGPQAGPCDRHPGLERNGRASAADSIRQAQERRRAAAAPACLAGVHAAYGHPQAHLPGGGGPDPLLRPSALPVWADRNHVDPRTSPPSRTSPS